MKNVELIATTMRDEIKGIIKEAFREVLQENKIFLGGVDLSNVKDESPKIAKNEFVETSVAKETKKTSKKEEVKEEVKEDEAGESDDSARRAELTAMKYNNLKALLSSLGGKAVGSKEDIINQILELESGSQEAVDDKEEEHEAEDSEAEDSEDDSNDEADEDAFREFLAGLDRTDLEAVADECGIKYTNKTKDTAIIEKCVADVEKLVEVLTTLGYYDEEEDENDDENDDEEAEESDAETEESEDDEADDDDDEENEEDVATQLGLNDMEVEELADILAQNNLSTKGKKQALIDRIVKAVEDGEIELEESEEEEAPKKEEKKADKKADKKSEKAETKKPVKTNNKRSEAEKKVEDNIRAFYGKKQLKDKAIATFLKYYLDGDSTELSKEEALEKYIEINKMLVDDDGNVSPVEEAYIRDEKYHCCGHELKDMDNGHVYCEICGNEYEA